MHNEDTLKVTEMSGRKCDLRDRSDLSPFVLRSHNSAPGNSTRYRSCLFSLPCYISVLYILDYLDSE